MTTETTSTQQPEPEQDGQAAAPTNADEAPAKARRKHRRDKDRQPKPERTARNWGKIGKNSIVGGAVAAIMSIVLADFSYSIAESYDTVAREAARLGIAFPQYAPFSLDFGLLALIGIDAVITLTAKDHEPHNPDEPEATPTNAVRYAIWVFTGLLVLINVAPHAPNKLGMAMAAAPALLIILFTETGRAIILRKQLARERLRKKVERARRKQKRVPRARWFMQPFESWQIYRLIVLRQADTYDAASNLYDRWIGMVQKIEACYTAGLDAPEIRADIAKRLRTGRRLNATLDEVAKLIKNEDRITVLNREHAEQLARLERGHAARMTDLMAGYAAERSSITARTQALQDENQALQERSETLLAATETLRAELESAHAALARKRSRGRAGTQKRSTGNAPDANESAPGGRSGSAPRGRQNAPDAVGLEAKALLLQKTEPHLFGPRNAPALAAELGCSPGYARKLRDRLNAPAPTTGPLPRLAESVPRDQGTAPGERSGNDHAEPENAPGERSGSDRGAFADASDDGGRSDSSAPATGDTGTGKTE